LKGSGESQTESLRVLSLTAYLSASTA